MRKLSWSFAAFALVAGLHSAAIATVPQVIPFQGKLTDASGKPIPSGSRSIVFTLFPTLTGGTATWTETQGTVTVTDGLFSVDLGAATPLSAGIFTGGDLYLEIAVGGETMTPRQRLGSVAHALRAGMADAISFQVATDQIQDAAVTAAKILDEPALGYNTRGSITANGIEDVISVIANFPAAGFAFVVGNVLAIADIPATNQNCYGVGISDVSATSPNWNYDCFSNVAGNPVHRETTISVFRAFAVTPGAKTFFLVGREHTGSWTISHGQLAVLYFPTSLGSINITAPQDEPAIPSGAVDTGNVTP